ncbi:MAG TPA: nitroreductase family protein [Acidimicrobiales bacterium]|nr:nitroreductase family protein [Acidimicrobiales bacterium]
MDVFEAIRTTRAMRRIDPDRPVSDADLRTIVEAATKGPSGGNSQPVRWLVVTDPEKRRRLGEIYQKAWEPVSRYYKTQPMGDTPVMRSADHLGEHFADAPAVVIPCAAQSGMTGDSSVFGAVQNLCLAARALGLGTTLTTVHKLHEQEVRDVLGIPDDVVTYCMIPVGYPTGKWGEAKRKPVDQVMYWNTWEQPPPAG